MGHLFFDFLVLQFSEQLPKLFSIIMDLPIEGASLHRVGYRGAHRRDVERLVNIVARRRRKACRIVSVVSKAVIITTSIVGSTNFSRSRTSMPDMPAIQISAPRHQLLILSQAMAEERIALPSALQNRL
jgi:TRAP-type C4-dicarboxylate transport system permease small subunit